MISLNLAFRSSTNGNLLRIQRIVCPWVWVDVQRYDDIRSLWFVVISSRQEDRERHNDYDQEYESDNDTNRPALPFARLRIIVVGAFEQHLFG